MACCLNGVTIKFHSFIHSHSYESDVLQVLFPCHLLAIVNNVL